MRGIACLVLACCSLWSPLRRPRGAELVLEDGQRLSGRSVERKGDLTCCVSIRTRLPIPVELVAELRLTGDKRPSRPA